MSDIVYIACPRCCGQGHGNWRPDAGICYRCRGARQVQVDVKKTVGALHMLRDKYRRIRAELAEARKAGNENVVDFCEEALRYCTEDGLRVKAMLETAGVKL